MGTAEKILSSPGDTIEKRKSGLPDTAPQAGTEVGYLTTMAFRKNSLMKHGELAPRSKTPSHGEKPNAAPVGGEIPGDLLHGLSRQAEIVPLADAAAWYLVEDMADRICQRMDSPAQIKRLDDRVQRPTESWPLGARIATRLAHSRKALQWLRKPVHLSVVIPVFSERRRLLPPADHPLGEAWLGRKIAQLQWLFGNRKEHSWDMVLVDDGCPEGSGHLIREVLDKQHPEVRARVLFLEEAVRRRHPALNGLKSAADSRKGGAVHLGLWEAARLRVPNQVVLYTDADLSTHLGQAGLLIKSLRKPGMLIAAGSRRSPSSIVVKDGYRQDRGRLFIYLWKQLVPQLAYLDDTQCGFKALRPEVIMDLVSRATEHGFATDFELLAHCENRSPRSIDAVPIAWIDSPAASTTTAEDPYLSMLRSIEKLSRSCFARTQEAEAFARMISSLTQAGWQTAVEAVGPRLQNIPPAMDLSHKALSPQDLDFASS